MEIKNLRYFLAVAREENMSHAAEMMHVTQPTLSKALKALEEELGKKLFTRHSFSRDPGYGSISKESTSVMDKTFGKERNDEFKDTTAGGADPGHRCPDR